MTQQDHARLHANRSDSGSNEVVVHRCAIGRCSNRSERGCEVGHHGPLCSLCIESWAPSGGVCQKCGDFGSESLQYVAATVAGVLACVVWYLVSCRPYVRKDGTRELDDLDDKRICGSRLLAAGQAAAARAMRPSRAHCGRTFNTL
eukprot:1268994-Rhodomonas_salina.1